MTADYDNILDYEDWYHRIDLRDGRYTPGRFNGPNHWQTLGLPDDMSGKSFLDVGAANGLHSFEAEKRGAESVLAVDIWAAQKKEAGIHLAKSYMDSDVEIQEMNAYDVAEETVGNFDVVLCSGLLYHNHSPYPIVENLAEIADELLVLESSINEYGSEPVLEVEKSSSMYAALTAIPSVRSMEVMVDAAGLDPEASYTVQGRVDDRTQTGGGDVPEVTFGTLRAGSTLYRTRELSQPKGEGLEEPADDEWPYPSHYWKSTVESDRLAKITYESEDAVRVANARSDGEKFDGWTRPENIVSERSQKKPNLILRGLSHLQREGPVRTATATYEYLFSDERGSRGIVHGRQSSE